jgi:hypothetical protein
MLLIFVLILLFVFVQCHHTSNFHCVFVAKINIELSSIVCDFFVWNVINSQLF